MEYEGNDDTNYCWCPWNSPQTFGKRTRRIGNQGKNQYHLDYCIVETGRNPEKSPGDVRRFAITQATMKKNSENLAKSVIMIITIIIKKL